MGTIGAVSVIVAGAAVAPATAVSSTGAVSSTTTIDARPRRTPSFNGPVFAVAFRGDTVYVGGSFTGVMSGGKTVSRLRLAAFNARSGALLAWRPRVNGTVKALAVDGRSVYAAGDFGNVSGRRRDSVARLDARSGAVGTFAHSVTGEAAVLAVGSGRLYVGGHFSAVDRSRRGSLAAFSLSSGALDRNWRPMADDRVSALAPAGSRVYVGGSFHRINGARGTVRFAAVSASSGRQVSRFRPKTPAKVLGLAVTRKGVFAATGGAGGRAIAYSTSGRVLWTHLFDGDVHTLTTLRGITYVGGHFDRACVATSTIKQLGCIGGKVSRRKLAALDSHGRLTSWNPRANGIVGVRALATNTARGEIGAGGEFTRIGTVPRERYASFGG